LKESSRFNGKELVQTTHGTSGTIETIGTIGTFGTNETVLLLP
jgi:hypothetical protein